MHIGAPSRERDGAQRPNVLLWQITFCGIVQGRASTLLARQRSKGDGMRRRFCGLVLFGATVLFAAFSAQAAYAAPSGDIAPYIRCPDGAETIPAGSQLAVISAWGTGSKGNAAHFLDHQVLVWDVVSPTGALLATSGSRTFGDTFGWSTPVRQEATVEGQKQWVWITRYRAATGIVLAAGQSVTLRYNWVINKKLDDDFGTKIEPGTLYSTSSCTITGA